MYIIVGLGNPGKKYENTRHNMGFLAVDVLAQKYDIKIRHAASQRAEKSYERGDSFSGRGSSENIKKADAVDSGKGHIHDFPGSDDLPESSADHRRTDRGDLSSA